MLEAFLASTVAMATPILLAALGELLVEQSGVINVGIEGSMLAGAFFALAAAYFSGSLALGLLAGVAAAVALNALLALLVVNLAVNQVVAGTALDILALGLTGVFYRRMFGVTGSAFVVRQFGAVALGPLARIPLVGRAFFDQNLLVYIAFAMVPLFAFVISRTRYGLRLRAAGERPEAADALGLGVYRLRWEALCGRGRADGAGRRVFDPRLRGHLRRGNVGRSRLRRAGGGDSRALEGVGMRGGLDAVRRGDGVAVRLAGARHRGAVPGVSRAAVRADVGGAGGLRRPGRRAERAGRALRRAREF